MQEIDAIQNKRESKIISSINNDTSENGYIVFDYCEKSGYRNFDTIATLNVKPFINSRNNPWVLKDLKVEKTDPTPSLDETGMLYFEALVRSF